MLCAKVARARSPPPGDRQDDPGAEDGERGENDERTEQPEQRSGWSLPDVGRGPGVVAGKPVAGRADLQDDGPDQQHADKDMQRQQLPDREHRHALHREAAQQHGAGQRRQPLIALGALDGVGLAAVPGPLAVTLTMPRFLCGEILAAVHPAQAQGQRRAGTDGAASVSDQALRNVTGNHGVAPTRPGRCSPGSRASRTEPWPVHAMGSSRRRRVTATLLLVWDRGIGRAQAGRPPAHGTRVPRSVRLRIAREGGQSRGGPGSARRRPDVGSRLRVSGNHRQSPAQAAQRIADRTGGGQLREVIGNRRQAEHARSALLRALGRQIVKDPGGLGEATGILGQ